MNFDHTHALKALFSAFPSGATQDTVGLYVDRLKQVPPHALQYAVDHFIANRRMKSVPSLAEIFSASKMETRTDDSIHEKRETELRYWLPRMGDIDYWAFTRVFGVEPNRDLFSRLGVEPGPEMSFNPMSPADERAARETALREVTAAIKRTVAARTMQ